jgi:hypothetical protein
MTIIKQKQTKNKQKTIIKQKQTNNKQKMTTIKQKQTKNKQKTKKIKFLLLHFLQQL